MLIRCEAVKSWLSFGGGRACQVNRKLVDEELVKWKKKKKYFKIQNDLKLKKKKSEMHINLNFHRF